MSELFPDIQPVSQEKKRSSQSAKAPFRFQDPLVVCPRPSCLSRGPYKIRMVNGELERACLKCGFAFAPGSKKSEEYRQKCYKEQLAAWEESCS